MTNCSLQSDWMVKLRYGFLSTEMMYWSDKLAWSPQGQHRYPSRYDGADCSVTTTFAKFVQMILTVSPQCFAEERSLSCALYYGTLSDALDSLKALSKFHAFERFSAEEATVADTFFLHLANGIIKISILFPSRSSYRIRISSLRIDFGKDAPEKRMFCRRSRTGIVSETYLDVLQWLQRLDIDTCRVVCSQWQKSIEHWSEALPRHNIAYCRVFIDAAHRISSQIFYRNQTDSEDVLLCDSFRTVKYFLMDFTHLAKVKQWSTLFVDAYVDGISFETFSKEQHLAVVIDGIRRALPMQCMSITRLVVAVPSSQWRAIRDTVAFADCLHYIGHESQRDGSLYSVSNAAVPGETLVQELLGRDSYPSSISFRIGNADDVTGGHLVDQIISRFTTMHSTSHLFRVAKIERRIQSFTETNLHPTAFNIHTETYGYADSSLSYNFPSVNAYDDPGHFALRRHFHGLGPLKPASEVNARAYEAVFTNDRTQERLLVRIIHTDGDQVWLRKWDQQLLHFRLLELHRI